MIKNLSISNIASFKNSISIDLKNINFFYGDNGSGKTTISNVLNDINAFSSCLLTNVGDSQILVYNKNFVDANFTDNSKINGVYTLGIESNHVISEIEAKEKILQQKIMDLENKENVIDKLSQEKTTKYDELKERCWKARGNLANDFKKVFEGLLRKEAFINFFLTFDKKRLNNLDNSILLKEYEFLYNSTLKTLEKNLGINLIDIETVPNIELFEFSITGKDNLEISQLIKQLQNSDWVNAGLKFLNDSNDKCPFCQQNISSNIIDDLNDFFDKTYLENIDKIRYIKVLLQNNLFNFNYDFKEIYNFYSSYFKMNDFLSTYELLKKEYEAMLERIDYKLAHPSEKIIVKNLAAQKEISQCLLDLEKTIDEHNRKCLRQNEEKELLKQEIFAILSEKIEPLIINFINVKSGIEKGLSKLDKEYEHLKNEILVLKKDISILRGSISGISNSIQSINNILSSFGYNGFRLKETADECYKIVRQDGTNVGKTLSEGEHRFISFLYFYQLINGTLSSSEDKKNRIVVIDDPVSSLDSNILFIISTLVKSIIDKCLNKSDGIEQVIILTHNVYFHKEITHRPRGIKSAFSNNNVSYYIISKKDENSDIVSYDKNPISTTYQLLWDEMKPENTKSKATVFNTMRRILEYYFNVLGGLNYEKIIACFEDDEKQICQSLLSCINDNSHYITDDFMIIVTDDLIRKYIMVFKKIFEKTNHLAHFQMMMGLEDINEYDYLVNDIKVEKKQIAKIKVFT